MASGGKDQVSGNALHLRGPWGLPLHLELEGGLLPLNIYIEDTYSFLINIFQCLASTKPSWLSDLN